MVPDNEVFADVTFIEVPVEEVPVVEVLAASGFSSRTFESGQQKMATNNEANLSICPNWSGHCWGHNNSFFFFLSISRHKIYFIFIFRDEWKGSFFNSRYIEYYKVTHYCVFWKSKQIMCFMEGWVR